MQSSEKASEPATAARAHEALHRRRPAPRQSLLFKRGDPHPEQRHGDRSAHRLYHHYYEDMLS